MFPGVSLSVPPRFVPGPRQSTPWDVVADGGDRLNYLGQFGTARTKKPTVRETNLTSDTPGRRPLEPRREHPQPIPTWLPECQKAFPGNVLQSGRTIQFDPAGTR